MVVFRVVKLNENQLREIIQGVLVEAKTSDEDAVKQFISAMMTAYKLGPVVSSALHQLSQDVLAHADDEALETMYPSPYEVGKKLSVVYNWVNKRFGNGLDDDTIDVASIKNLMAAGKKITKNGVKHDMRAAKAADLAGSARRRLPLKK